MKGGRKSWTCDKDNIEKMLQEEGHICVINPLDEMPHLDVTSGSEIHFQHGDTKIGKNDVSVAFVFRVSPHECLCNITNNHVVLSPEMVAEVHERNKVAKVKQSDRIKLYEQFDIALYHREIISRFNSIINK